MIYHLPSILCNSGAHRLYEYALPSDGSKTSLVEALFQLLLLVSSPIAADAVESLTSDFDCGKW